MRGVMKTKTPVHDEKSMLGYRASGMLREHNELAGALIFSQLLCAGALYLLPVAATSAWWAAALLVIPAGLMYLAARLLASKLDASAPQRPLFRALLGISVLLFISDMAMCLLSLVELTTAFILPDSPRWLTALAVAVAVPLGLSGRGQGGAARMARLLRFFLLGALLLCAVIVLPYGERGYLFPWAGFGVGHTLRSALWTAGSLWGAVLPPLFAVGQKKEIARRAKGFRVLLVAMAVFAFLLFCCAFLLPATSLAGSWGYALRLQTIMEMSPSSLSWSLMLTAQLFLFLLSLAGAAVCAKRCLMGALALRSVPVLPLTLLCVPLAVIGAGAAERVLVAALPWRSPLAIVLLAIGLIGTRTQKKEAAA